MSPADPQTASPLEQLQRYKQTMKRVAHELANKGDTWQPTLSEDRLSLFMRAISLFERGQEAAVRKLLGRYEELARVCGQLVGGRLLSALKDHAQELSNTSLLDRIQ